MIIPNVVTMVNVCKISFKGTRQFRSRDYKAMEVAKDLVKLHRGQNNDHGQADHRAKENDL
jgi:hypothetical protein